MISEEYRELNKQLHADVEAEYGQAGRRWVKYLTDACNDYHCSHILDYGCGKGTLKKEILLKTPNISVTEYDPAIEGKDTSPSPAELVFCGDVLEHIEPEHLDSVLADIARCTDRMAILYIATNEAHKTLPDGRNAHLIQENFQWWFNRISEHMEIFHGEVFKKHRILVWTRPLGDPVT